MFIPPEEIYRQKTEKQANSGLQKSGFWQSPAKDLDHRRMAAE